VFEEEENEMKRQRVGKSC